MGLISGLAERGLPVRGPDDIKHLKVYAERWLCEVSVDELLARFEFRFDVNRADRVRAPAATFEKCVRFALSDEERSVMAASARGRVMRSATAPAATGGRASTTDQRVAAGMALAEKYDALERSAG